MELQKDSSLTSNISSSHPSLSSSRPGASSNQQPPDYASLTGGLHPGKQLSAVEFPGGSPLSTNTPSSPGDRTTGEIRIQRFSKAVFTRTNLLVGAAALTLTTLCYRYLRYTGLKAHRDDCRALAVSLDHRLLVIINLGAH